MKRFACICLIACAAAGHAEEVLLGNGRLTLRVNEHLQIMSCYWPNPSFAPQLREEDPTAPAAAWGIQLSGEEDRVAWLSGAVPADPLQNEFLVLGQRFALPGQPELAGSLCVHPEKDLILYQWSLESPGADLRLCWSGGFAPATSPAAGVLRFLGLGTPTGFASFSPRPETLIQFRPAQPGQAEWARAQEVRSLSPDPAAWKVFGKGVWIITSMVGDGVALLPASEDAAGILGRFQGHPRASGTRASLSLLIAFGATLEDAEQAMAYGRGKPVEALLEETRGHWREWLAGSPPPSGAEASAWNSALLRLAVAGEEATRAPVSQPAAQTGLSIITPTDAAAAALAWTAAGRADFAGRALRWCFTLASGGNDDGLYGSIPPAVLTSGAPVLPPYLHDVRGPAWLLGASLRHANALGEAERAAFVADIGDPVQRSGDLLASWIHAGSGDLLPSWDQDALRDTVTQEARLVVWMGLACAQRLVVEAAPAAWAERMRELETQLSFQVLHKEQPWSFDPLLKPLLESTLPDQHGVWGPVVGAGEEAAAVVAPASTPEPGLPFRGAREAALYCLAQTLKVYGQI